MEDRAHKGFSFIKRIRSFKNAFSGLADMIRTEPNAWIHSIATFVVLGLCWWTRMDALHFTLIVLAIVSVWVAEAFNTVIEIVLDFVSPEYSDVARRAKDIAAAAVLITCIGAIVLGVILLGPALIARLSS